VAVQGYCRRLSVAPSPRASRARWSAAPTVSRGSGRSDSLVSPRGASWRQGPFKREPLSSRRLLSCPDRQKAGRSTRSHRPSAWCRRVGRHYGVALGADRRTRIGRCRSRRGTFGSPSTDRHSVVDAEDLTPAFRFGPGRAGRPRPCRVTPLLGVPTGCSDARAPLPRREHAQGHEPLPSDCTLCPSVPVLEEHAALRIVTFLHVPDTQRVDLDVRRTAPAASAVSRRALQRGSFSFGVIAVDVLAHVVTIPVPKSPDSQSIDLRQGMPRSATAFTAKSTTCIPSRTDACQRS